jgi:asparagine synthase (glutamine-hydrolysing)
VVHNGEIYNFRALARELTAAGHILHTGSDSEVIVHLFETMGEACVDRLDGIFAFAAMKDGDWLVARDPIGVKPLYYGRDAAGNLWFASELKALVDRCVSFEVFPPGHLMTKRGGLRRWYAPAWLQGSATTTADADALRPPCRPR